MSDAFILEVESSCRVRVNIPTRARLFETIQTRLDDRCGFTLATLNLDHLVKLRLSTVFRRAYAAHSFVIADGNPIVWLSRLARRPVKLIPGCELLEPLCALAARRNVPVALIGSTEKALTRAATRLTDANPGLRIVLLRAPSGDFDPNGPEAGVCIADLAKSGAQLCFIALGAPKQEVFAARAHEVLPGCGFVSIGAGIDFLAGTQRRAPAWVRRLTLEWVWRLATNPRRLGMRYLKCAGLLPALAWRALRVRRTPSAQEPQNA